MESKRPWSTRNYIELDFFAGAPNPRWELTDQEARELMTTITRGERRGPGETFVEAESGYGGVILHVAEPTGPGRYFTIFNEQVFDSSGDVVLNDAGRAVERLLFAKAPDEAAALIERLAFDEAVTIADFADEELEVVTGAARAAPNCPQAPVFEVAPPPVRWNGRPGRDDNNCYNYANDVFSTIDDALPGGVMRHQWTELEMHGLLVGDGLVPVDPVDRKQLPMVCSTEAQAHLVAVYLRRRRGSRTENGASVPNFTDFHCYRLDRGAVWSHKDGRKKTSQNAKSGRIVDITTARFTLKHTLVGFYWTFPGPHRRIRTP